eukprot:jgi/Mesen1/923/ME000117S00080
MASVSCSFFKPRACFLGTCSSGLKRSNKFEVSIFNRTKHAHEALDLHILNKRSSEVAGTRRKRFSTSGVCRCEATSQAASVAPTTEWFQKTIELPPYKRGCHIITSHISRAVPELAQFRVGLAHIFVMHTSASLTINENASPDVPADMEDSLNRLVPEARSSLPLPLPSPLPPMQAPALLCACAHGGHFRHLDEGYDDMPAHVKASLMGSSLSIPITAGKLGLGMWQGIWLNEHRNYGGARTLCITLHGERRTDGR